MSRQGLSWKEKLKYAIDQVIKVSEDFDDFLAKCKDFGVLVEYDPDHKIDLKYMLAEQKERNPRARFTRSRTLGWFYFLELMMSTDGDERDRAECVYIQLMTLNNDRLAGERKYFSESSETITGKTIR